MSKRKESPQEKSEQHKRSLSELFTMTDERSQEAGTYYTLDTSVESRKDVKMTRTRARTPQFEVFYDGETKTLTIPIKSGTSTRAEWPYVLADFIKLKLNPPKEVYVEGWVAVDDKGLLTDGAISRLREKAEKEFKRKSQLESDCLETTSSDSE